jgi:hypothetical protein
MEQVRNIIHRTIILSQLSSIYHLWKRNPLRALSIHHQFITPQNLLLQFSLFIGLIASPFFCISLIHASGFGSLGLRKGSLATEWQKTFHGNVPTTSIFSHLQMIGRTGVLPMMWVFASCVVGMSICGGSAVVGVYLYQRMVGVERGYEEAPLLAGDHAGEERVLIEDLD